MSSSSSSSDTAVVEPETAPAKPKTDPSSKPQRQPPYSVVLLDDDQHTYPYVIEVLQRVFGYNFEKAYTLTKQVDKQGRAAVWTGTMEGAELKRELVVGFGPDVYARRAVTFPLGCIIEPLPQ